MKKLLTTGGIAALTAALYAGSTAYDNRTRGEMTEILSFPIERSRAMRIAHDQREMTKIVEGCDYTAITNTPRGDRTDQMTRCIGELNYLDLFGVDTSKFKNAKMLDEFRQYQENCAYDLGQVTNFLY